MNEQRTILVVDDDNGLRELLRINLEHEGYNVIQAQDGVQCVQLVREQRPDMVILDVMMPEMDGIEACGKVREFSQVPILILTGKVQSDDVITGLDRGADDYLLKPFNMDELSARIRTLLRRAPLVYRTLSVGDGQIQIDQQKRQVCVREEVVDLTPTEYHLLLILAENAGTVVAFETLLRAVWGQEYTRDNDYLKVYIWHLRRKIELDPRNPLLLLTEWGVGYRLVPGDLPSGTYSSSPNSKSSEASDQHTQETRFYSLIQQVAQNSDETLLTVSVLGNAEDKRVVVKNGVLIIPYAQQSVNIDNSRTDIVTIVPTHLIEISTHYIIDIFYAHPLVNEHPNLILAFGYASGPASTANELIEQVAGNFLDRLQSQMDDTVTIDPPVLLLQPGRAELLIKHRNISATYNSILQSTDRNNEIREEIDFLTAVVRHDLRGSTAAIQDITKQMIDLVRSQGTEGSTYFLIDTIKWLQCQVLLCMTWQYSLARLGNALPLSNTTITLLPWLEANLRTLNMQLLLGMAIEIDAEPKVLQLQISLEEQILLAAWLHILLGLHESGATKIRCLISSAGHDDFEIQIEHDVVLSNDIGYIHDTQSLTLSVIHQKYIHFILLSHLLRVLQINWDYEAQQSGGKFIWSLSRVSSSRGRVKKISDIAHEIEYMQQYIALHSDVAKGRSISRSQGLQDILKNLLRPYIEGIEGAFAELIRRASTLRLTNEQILKVGHEELSKVLAPRLIGLSRYSRLLARNLAFAVQGERLPPEVIDINREIRFACDMLEHKLSGIGIELALTNLVLHAHIASIEIEQIFVNLIKNASEALESLPMQNRKIHIITMTRGKKVIVRIEDTGPGIATKNRKKIFQLNFTTKSRGKNSGIGLHAVQTIIHGAGGAIHIASTSETQSGRLQSWTNKRSLKRAKLSRTGTVFEIELPLVQPD